MNRVIFYCKIIHSLVFTIHFYDNYAIYDLDIMCISSHTAGVFHEEFSL